MEPGTRDNILKFFITAGQYEIHEQPLLVVLVDITQCFDRTRAQDVIMETIRAGCDLKVVKYLNEWIRETEIVLSGDYTGASGRVRDTVGQGTSLAAIGVSLLIGVALEMNVVKDFMEHFAEVGRMKSLPQAFVDDMLAMAKDCNGLRLLAKGLSLAARYSSMEVNKEKSSVLVIGRRHVTVEAEEELKANPVLIQEQEIQVKEDDVYLGITISNRGVRESIYMTMEARFKKAKSRAYQLRNISRHPTFLAIGWLKSIVTFFKASVASTLLYAAETWYQVSEKFGDYIEAKYRSLLLIMLGFPKTTRYLSLLHELDVCLAKHLIAGRRIKYLNKILNGQSNPQTRKIVLEEYMSADDDVKKYTFMGHVQELCSKYDVPDVTKHNGIDDETIGERVREVNDIECWEGSMAGKLNSPTAVSYTHQTLPTKRIV